VFLQRLIKNCEVVHIGSQHADRKLFGWNAHFNDGILIGQAEDRRSNVGFCAIFGTRVMLVDAILLDAVGQQYWTVEVHPFT
jgi:hypothetical protein